MAAGEDLEAGIVDDDGTAPCTALREARGALHDIEEGQCVGTGSQRVGMLQGSADEMGEHQAFARGGAVGGLGDAPVERRQLGRGEARTVGHALAQRKFGEVAQALDGWRGRLNDITKLRVVAELK